MDGALLLAWAGYIVWLADRRKSEVLALFAIGLAYYTSFITNVGVFTLFSNLVLTSAAVFFLVRNRWAALSVTSLVATYAGFAFWRFHQHADGAALTSGELWLGNGFLSAYWVLFTAAVFLSRSESLAAGKRAAFASLNNAAFFSLVLLSMRHVDHGNFWLFSLCYGAAQLALAALAKRFLQAEPAVKNAYLTQGVLLVTVGFIAKFSGLNLALVLAAESVVLLILGRQQGNIILHVGAFAAGVLAVCWGVADTREFDRAGLLVGATVGAMMLFNAWWSARASARSDDKGADETNFFAALALVMWAITTSRNTTTPVGAIAFAVESTGFLVASGPLRIRFLELGAYPFALFAAWLACWKMQALGLIGCECCLLTGAVLLANSYFGKARATGERAIPPGVQANFFTALALFVWLWATWLDSAKELRGLWLAVESVAFLVAGQRLASVALVFGGRAFGALAVASATHYLLEHFDSGATVSFGAAWPNALTGALLLGNALIERHTRAQAAGDFAPTRAFFTVLALVMWLATTWCCAPADWRAPLLACEALLFTSPLFVLGFAELLVTQSSPPHRKKLESWIKRLTELAVFGQVFLLLAQLTVAVLLLENAATVPWWSPAVVIAISVAHGHWWQRTRANAWFAGAQQFFLGAYALAATALLYLWLHPQFSAPHWLAFASLLALAITAYGVVTRAWFLAGTAQLLLASSVLEFLRQLYYEPTTPRPEWFLALAPIAVLTALSFATMRGLARAGQTKSELGGQLTVAALVYRVTAVALALGWVFRYIAAEDRFWFLALVGAAFFALSGWRQSREALRVGAVFTLMGWLVFLSELGTAELAYWANLPAILLLLAQQRAARLLPQRYPLTEPIHTAAIIVGGGSVWLFLSKWVTLKAGGFDFFLTAAWAGLALAIFAAGFACRERIYRWHGLAVLACAIARVCILDVWKLELLYRILSFMALGAVLLVLGFIYNKYEEKIKEWL